MQAKNQGIAFAKRLLVVLGANADAERARAMERYMRNQFRFFGIAGPRRKELMRSFVNEWRALPMSAARSAVQWLWSQEERECQYIAMELYQRRQKDFEQEDLTLIEALIVVKSWWDTVDFLAANLAGPYFLRYSGQMEPVTNRWSLSDHLWLRRSSVLFQLKYKDQTREDLLFGYCAKCAGEKDFFIRKAIGWALRQFAKTEPEKVRRFLRSHKLSALSTREALKSLI